MDSLVPTPDNTAPVGQEVFSHSSDLSIQAIIQDESRQLLKLFQEYEDKKKRIATLSGFFEDHEYRSIVHYFISGNTSNDYQRYSARIDSQELFQQAGAVKVLDATYWSKAIKLTGVFDVMPEARRQQWNENIQKHETESFTPEIVIPTLQEFLNSRLRFLAEKVDGIFKGLSGLHVTNSPYGFNKRMIMSNVILSYGCVNHTKSGHINDLRSVVSMFMARGGINHDASYQLISRLQSETGVWHEVDGGALRLKLFKNGNAHLEVHPDIAWRLNEVLATLYPMQIPTDQRKPPRKTVNVTPLKETLPFDVINALSRLWHWGNEQQCSFRNEDDYSKSLKDRVIRIMEGLGAQLSNVGFVFPYPCKPVIDQVVMSGSLPEKQSHQFYPTPKHLAERVMDYAEIAHGHTCLEPSAGLGNLADFMPLDQTQCVELSELYCKVLQEKGFRVDSGDFLKWSDQAGSRFDRIVMNPPYTKGQALLHLEAAMDLLDDSGRIVAILPASLRCRKFMGFDTQWSEVLEGQFSDTGVRVVIGVFDKI